MGATVFIRAFLFFYFFFFTVASLSLESAAQSRNNGLGVEIIPLDSPSSPFYNSSDTFSSRIKKAGQRSLARLQHLSSMTAASPNDLQPPVISTGLFKGGDYLMKLSLGSPGFEIFALMETGNDLIWTQCIPCDKCYHQSAPMFDPAKSSSYTNLDCSSSSCDDLSGSCTDRVCNFRRTYSDGTDIRGFIAHETMTLDSSDGKKSSFPIIFGCGHDDSSSTFPSTTAGGVVGLGISQYSLISQLGPVASGKFSYCLGDDDYPPIKSVLNFGPRAIVSEGITTPIVNVRSEEVCYYLLLNDISVGSQKLNIPPGTFQPSKKDGNSGLIIDAATAFTFLKQEVYDMLVTALKSAITFPLAQQLDPFKLCYQASSDDIKYSFPDVTFHFLGGDVVLGPWNIFVEVDKFACMAVLPTDGLSVYGNIVQQGFHVGYDLVKKTVSIAHADCSQL